MSQPPSRLHAFATSRAALLAVGAWAFAEASLWFIVPDVLAGLLVLFAPRRLWATLGAVVIGALLGALALGWLTAATGGVPGLLVAIPGITDTDLAHVADELEAHGAVAFLLAPFQAQPLKLYIHEATVLKMPFALVATFTVLNRIERVGAVMVVIAAIGIVLRRPIERRAWSAGAIYGAAWVAIYAYLSASRPL